MNAPSTKHALMISVLVAATCALPVAGSANDYYSWIDGNGTVMMTDDPSRVPPAATRSPVQVHRFEPVAPGQPAMHEAEPALREEAPAVAPVDPANLDLPMVVLGEPDNQMRAQYVWVPLLSPLFVGGNSINGFWWHPGATSPVEAFKQYLARHNRQQQTQWMPGAVVPYPPYHPGITRSSSGNPVYDQVVRERQALEESIRLRHFPGSPAPGRPSQNGPRGGGGSHSIRSR